jgi:hypothetical protein
MCYAYPERDSNPQPPQSEYGASADVWATRAWSGRKPSIVDNLGIEPSRRCLQDSAAHLCVAREPTVGLEPTTSALRGRRRSRPASLASRANGGSRTRTSRLQGGCTTVVLRWRTYPRRDSNAHHRPPHDRASSVGLRGHGLGAEDSNLHELLQRQPCCRVTSAPKGPAGSPARRPSSAHGEGGPRRSVRGGPQRHPRLGRRPVALALVAAATGGHRVQPGVAATP